MVKLFSSFIFLPILIIVILIHFHCSDVDNESERKISPNDSVLHLNIPARLADALPGSQFADQITVLSVQEREAAIVAEILSGNVPSFSRTLRPLKTIQTIGSADYEVIMYAMCDYMAVGSDEDYVYVPMTPSTAQFLANMLDCSLPTKKGVDIIYAEADIKLYPQPIPPSDKMTTVPVFMQHTGMIKQQIDEIGYYRSADSLIAGHKKDIIISNKIYSPDRNYERVVIYGWHRSENDPIQPVYNGHSAQYADYSHGVRLISNMAFINGDTITIEDILQDEKLSDLLSSEGVISRPYYPNATIK